MPFLGLILFLSLFSGPLAIIFWTVTGFILGFLALGKILEKKGG
jgi:hypothetical protein